MFALSLDLAGTMFIDRPEHLLKVCKADLNIVAHCPFEIPLYTVSWPVDLTPLFHE
jgi:hypothetical protein